MVAAATASWQTLDASTTTPAVRRRPSTPVLRDPLAGRRHHCGWRRRMVRSVRKLGFDPTSGFVVNRQGRDLKLSGTAAYAGTRTHAEGERRPDLGQPEFHLLFRRSTWPKARTKCYLNIRAPDHVGATPPMWHRCWGSGTAGDGHSRPAQRDGPDHAKHQADARDTLRAGTSDLPRPDAHTGINAMEEEVLWSMHEPWRRNNIH